MRTPLVAALCLALGLTACAGLRESRFNPLNWFGGSSSEVTVRDKELPPQERADPRPLVAEVTDMRVERVPGGALVTATGLSPTQGFWNAELVPDHMDDEAVDGVLSYSFRIVPPAGQRAVSTPQSRSVTAAHFVTDQKLARAKQIRVRGNSNQRVSRR